MKILIIHTFGMGDIIMFTPTLKKIREKYPNVKIDFLIFQKFAVNPIKNCDFINKIYTSSFKFNDIVEIIKILRNNKYDMSIVTSGTSPLKGGLFSFLIGAKERIGEYKKFKNILYTQSIKYIEKIHRVENNLLLIGERSKEIPFICGVKARMESKYKIRMGFHIGSNKVFSKKRWEKEKFIELIQKIKFEFKNIDIVIFSGPDEEDESKEVSEITNTSLFLNLPFKKLVEEIGKCNIFMNTDSGLGHIASCIKNIEIFTIFGPAKDYKAKPYHPNATVIKKGLECQPCYGTKRFKKCKTLDCLKNLSVNEVFNYIIKNSKVLNNAK